MTSSVDPRARAHLRALPRCRCGKPATDQLFSGVNASLGHFCARCGKAALARYKRGDPV